MSPRTGRPPKNGASRTERSITLRLTEDEANAIQSLAEYFDLSRTDTVVQSVRYLQDQIEQNADDIEKYLERQHEDFCETNTERLKEASEDNILEELEQFEQDEWEYFMEETLALLNEQALEHEEDFDRAAAIEHFKSTELPELIEKEKKKIEYRYEKNIENEVEEEWEIEKHRIRQLYFEIYR